MNNKPNCHPEKPESGQQRLTEEQISTLLDAATTADTLSHYLWRAYYAAQYKDEAKAEHSIDEARINHYILKNKLAQLPPSTSFPANMLPENEQ